MLRRLPFSISCKQPPSGSEKISIRAKTAGKERFWISDLWHYEPGRACPQDKFPEDIRLPADVRVWVRSLGNCIFLLLCGQLHLLILHKLSRKLWRKWRRPENWAGPWPPSVEVLPYWMGAAFQVVLSGTGYRNRSEYFWSRIRVSYVYNRNLYSGKLISDHILVWNWLVPGSQKVGMGKLQSGRRLV